MLYLFWFFSHFGLAIATLSKNVKFFWFLSCFFAAVFFGYFLTIDFYTDLLVYTSLFNSPYEKFHFAPAWVFIARATDLLAIPADYRLLFVQILTFFIILSVCSTISYKLMCFILLAPIFYLCMFNALGQGVASFFITCSVISFSQNYRAKYLMSGIFATMFHFSAPFFIATYLSIRLIGNFLNTLPKLLLGRLNKSVLITFAAIFIVVVVVSAFSGHFIRFAGYFNNSYYQDGRLAPILKSLYYGLALAPPLFCKIRCVELNEILKFSYGLLILVLLTNSIGAYELSSRISIQITANLPFIAYYCYSLGCRRSASFIVLMMGVSTQTTNLVATS